MALNINQPITTRFGDSLSSHYCRIDVTSCKCGAKAIIELYFYESKEKFQAGAITICRNERFTVDLVFSENFITDAHDLAKAWLLTENKDWADQDITTVDLD
jgi:hypothetical protein